MSGYRAAPAMTVLTILRTAPASLLPPDTLRELLAGIGAAIDAAGGGFTMHYATVALTAARAGAS